jgi:hypothetical protein
MKLKTIVNFLAVIVLITISTNLYSQKNQKQSVLKCIVNREFYIYKYGLLIETPTFYKDGTFYDSQVSRTGQWSYIGGRKIKYYQPWIGRTRILTIKSNCSNEINVD